MLLRPGAPDLFAHAGAEDVWLEHRESTRGRDLDITGLSWALLDAQGPQQWPLPAGAAQGRARLYEDRRFATPDGRARFVAAPYRPPAEARDAQWPLALNSGRSRDHWHGLSRSGTVARLFGHDPGPALRMHPHDLPRRGLREGDLVEVRSHRGALVLPLVADDTVGRAQACVAMHWGDEFVSGRGPGDTRLAGVNALTQAAFCPDSRQPELKFAAVAVTRLALPWRLTAAAWLDDDAAIAPREALRARMADFDYASCVPVAGPGGRCGLLFEAASAEAMAPALLDAIAALLGLEGPAILCYADPRRGRRRLLRLHGEGGEACLQSMLLAGEMPAADWLRTLWREAAPVAGFARHLLAPDGAAPGPVGQRAHQVCQCLGVSEPQIRNCLGAVAGVPGERLAALQSALKCGTQCGSCLPELRRIDKGVPALAETA